MNRIDSDILQIAARARSLEERLQDGRSPQVAASRPAFPDSSTEEIWERWCRAFADGDAESLQRRLSWDGLDETRARLALASSAGPTPAWTGQLKQIQVLGVEVAEELPDLAEVELFAGNPPPPFLELLVPFLRYARGRAGLGDRSCLEPTARGAFERALLAEMASTAAPAFYECWQQSARQGNYLGFVKSSLADAGLFTELSTLARQLTRLAVTWADSLAELLHRLARDRRELQATFGRGEELGNVVAVRPSLSDRHHDGRRVCRLTFAGGPSVVYKPRAVDLEAAFHGLTAWISEGGFEPAPRGLKILPRDGYGWVEAVDAAPAVDRSAAERYFQQAGALLGLTYVLGASDLHMDNVVATSDGPVVVDAETLLQPRRAANRPPTNALEQAREKLETSILSTGLLTFLQKDPEGKVYDIGGLSGRGGHLTAAKRRVWREVNTDAMQPRESRALGTSMSNLVELEGEVQEPRSYAAELVSGCAAMLRFLAEHRESILAPQGPLEAFAGLPTRVVFRGSDLYNQTLERLTSPPQQGHGLAGSLLLESLAKPFRKTRHRPQLWPLIVAERRSLEKLDVPRFALPCDETELTAAGEVVEGLFVESGLERARARLSRLDDASISEQVGILETVLAQSRHASSSEIDELSSTPLAPVAAADLVWQARRIGQQLGESAIRGEDGSVTWLSPTVLQGGQGASFHLYDGAAGVALFLAALSAVSGDGEVEQLVGGALEPLKQLTDHPDATDQLAGGKLGVCHGLGSLIYALTHIASLSRADAALDLAQRWARRITAERIAADRVLDVEGGTAGALLALLALHELEPRDWIVERAVCCAEHLISASSPGDRGAGRAWRNDRGVQQVGLAHGASGIALALLRLATLSDRSPLGDLALEAFAYERSLFDRQAGGWPVLEASDDGVAARFGFEAWCHGAAGIASVRAEAATCLDDQAVAEDLETALSLTRDVPLSDDNYLCCGNLGRVEALLAAGEILDRRDLVEASRALVASILRRGVGGQQPGFFRGAAGVGYTWLRLAHPATLPSVLLFQTPRRVGARQPILEVTR